MARFIFYISIKTLLLKSDALPTELRFQNCSASPTEHEGLVSGGGTFHSKSPRLLSTLV